MSTDGELSVVILYTHPLLGEGLAHLLASEPGLTIATVWTRDLNAAELALASRPDVVILEHTEPMQAVDLLKLAPGALLIELGIGIEPTFTYHREEISGQPEGIVRAIRQLRVHGVQAIAGVAGFLVAVSAAASLFGGS